MSPVSGARFAHSHGRLPGPRPSLVLRFQIRPGAPDLLLNGNQADDADVLRIAHSTGVAPFSLFKGKAATVFRSFRQPRITTALRGVTR